MTWKNFRLGELLQNRDDRFKPKDKKIQNLKRIEKIDFSGKLYISDKISNTDMILIKPGDLVISGINVEKGAMAVYDGKEEITATIHYSSYSYNPDKIDIDFLKLFLKSPEFKSALKEQVPGGIKTEIKPKHLLPLLINIPATVSDQKKVVKQFTDVNYRQNDIENELANQLSVVKKLRQSFLQEAMQGKLTEQKKEDGNAHDLLEKIKEEKAKSAKKEKPLPPIKDEEIPFEIPKNWVWCRLGEIINFISGNNFNSTDFTKGEGVRCIKITNAGVGELIETDDVLPFAFLEKYKSFVVYENDLVLALTRPYISEGLKISKCSKTYNNSLLNQRVAVIRVRLNISSDYIYQFLRSDYILNIYKAKFKGKGQQPNLKKEDVTELLIPLPPLPEQARIVKKLDELMHLCDELEAGIKQSQEQNQMLLQQVLREALAG
ncbi:MAG: hypothetical protein AMXMBFR48_24080 [Ignavibacteriales bacterium]